MRKSKFVILPELTNRQARYLEHCKKYSVQEMNLIDEASMDNDMQVLELVRERPLELLLAYKYGYTIEPEKKMLVTIKSYDQTESEFEIPESEAKKLIEELRGKHNEQ